MHAMPLQEGKRAGELALQTMRLRQTLALMLPDACFSAQEGKRAEELAAALPPHLRRSLLYEIESSGLKCVCSWAEMNWFA